MVRAGWVWACVVLTTGNLAAAGKRPPAPPPPPPASAWQPWTAAAFEQARASSRLVLVDAGMEGCTACREMHHDTWGDPRVMNLVARGFVAVQVDAEARPELADRFADWAWPATVVLQPDGTQVLALRGYRDAPTMVRVLEDVLARQRSGKLAADPSAPLPSTPDPPATELTALRDLLRAQLDAKYDARGAGWGGRAKTWWMGPLVNAAIRGRMGDRAAERRAMDTARAETGLLDPTWGGVFVGAVGGDWGAFIPEKRLGGQAAAMMHFALAFQATRDNTFRRAIAATHRYVSDVMTAPDGTFFTSQQDRAPGLPATTSARDYYKLDDAGRRALGIPPVDHAVYTDQCAEMAEALAQAFEATGERSYLQAAQAAVESMWSKRLHAEGWVHQASTDGPVSTDARLRQMVPAPVPSLAAQASLGNALLALFRVTGDPVHAHRSRRLLAVARARLWDARAGGFTSVPIPAAVAGEVRRPLEENGKAARWLVNQGTLDRDGAMLADARRAVLSVSDEARVKREGLATGQLAWATELVAAGPVEVRVVANALDAPAAALFRKALQVYEPRKLLAYERPGHYPDKGAPAAYVCTPVACSAAVTDAETLAAEMARAAAP